MIINIDYTTVNFNKKGKLTGVIYFIDEQIIFPDKKWFDSIDIILGWWLEELSKEDNIKFCFMEGPYFIEVKKDININSCELSFFEREVSKNRLVHKSITSITVLTKNILFCAKGFVQFCDLISYSNKDIVIIKELLDKMRH